MRKLLISILISAGALLLAAPSVFAYAVNEDGSRLERAPAPAPVTAAAVAAPVVAAAPRTIIFAPPPPLPPTVADPTSVELYITAKARTINTTAGPLTIGAFAYCNRGANAITPCSVEYFAPGTRLLVNPILIFLSDGQAYWVGNCAPAGVVFDCYVPQAQAG